MHGTAGRSSGVCGGAASSECMGLPLGRVLLCVRGLAAHRPGRCIHIMVEIALTIIRMFLPNK